MILIVMSQKKKRFYKESRNLWRWWV